MVVAKGKKAVVPIATTNDFLKDTTFATSGYDSGLFTTALSTLVSVRHEKTNAELAEKIATSLDSQWQYVRTVRMPLDKETKKVYIRHIDRLMNTQRNKTRQVRLDKPLMKMGGSLVVTLPNEVIEEWNLAKGDQVSLEVLDGAVSIKPKRPEKITTVSETSLKEYSRVMRSIQAKVTMDPESAALRIELMGKDKESINTILNNLWRNLPSLLRMLGLGSVETPEPDIGRRKGRKHGKSSADKVG